MKMIIGILFAFSSLSVHAKDLTLSQAKAEYTVRHLFKTVKGKSKDLKGKMVCEKNKCEFLVAIPAKSFISSDSNRDLNMQTVLEVTKFPFVIVKGSLDEALLSNEKFEVKSLVSLHGVEKEYNLIIKKGAPSTGEISVRLEDHKIERPSLLMAKIENEVPISFSFEWK